jgi:hypothetical protein
MHHIRLFLENGNIVCIHHNTDDPSNDEPGDPLDQPHGERVRFKSRDGDITIAFKNGKSPFVSGNLQLQAAQNTLTAPEELKPITKILEHFPYTATVAGVSQDPEIIIDEGASGGGAKKKAKKKKK